MERFSLRILVLSFVLTAQLGYSNHEQKTGSTDRPGGSKTEADSSYQQMKQLGDAGKDTDINLSSGKKIKLDGGDLSGKFKDLITRLEDFHKTISSDCKSKAGGKELDTLLRGFIDSFANEANLGTRKTSTGGLVNDQKNDSAKENAFHAERPAAAAAGVEKLLQVQEQNAKGEEAAKVKSQSKGLTGVLNGILSFFTGGKAEDAKPKDLAEVKPNGTKASKPEESVKNIVEKAKTDGDVCLFDKSTPSKDDKKDAAEETAPPATEPAPQVVASNPARPPSTDKGLANLLNGLNGKDGKDGKKEEKKDDSQPSATTPPVMPPVASSSPSGKSPQPPQGGGGSPSSSQPPQGGKDDGKGNQQPQQPPQMPQEQQKPQMPPMMPTDSTPQAPISQNDSQQPQQNQNTSDNKSSDQPNLNNSNTGQTVPAGGPGAITPTGPNGMPMAGYSPYAPMMGAPGVGSMAAPGVQQMAPPQISNFPR